MAEKTDKQLSGLVAAVIAAAGALGVGKSVQLALSVGIKALRAAAALGPYAPFAVALVVVATELRNTIRRGKARMSCKGWAAEYLIAEALAGGKGKPARIWLGEVPTSKNDDCWAKGQTRVDGRQGGRTPFTTNYWREDVLPGFPPKNATELDLLGRMNTGWTITIVPVLGPYAIPSEGRPFARRYLSFAPEGWAVIANVARALYEERPAWAEEQINAALRHAFAQGWQMEAQYKPYIAYLVDWLANAGNGRTGIAK